MAGRIMELVRADNVSFDYLMYGEDEEHPQIKHALRDVTLSVMPGSFIAILGRNGSGKSTFAKHINALLLPTEGSIYIQGTNTKEEPNAWKIRQVAGMVFQNPDNQIIATSVEEDVGFGPENLGIPREEIWERVAMALSAVGMDSFREMSPNRLSGGQKQRVAIAGIVAMKPKCIVLDEPTAMLDPSGRQEVLSVLHELNKKENVTIIHITHYMEEVVGADHIYVMDKGSVIAEGTPREIFTKVDLLREIHLDVPQVTLLAEALRKGGMDIPEGILTREELVDAVARAAGETNGLAAGGRGEAISGVGDSCVEGGSEVTA